MRRIDAIAIAIAFFGFGGIIFAGLQLLGLSSVDAGRWSQVALVSALMVWLATYAFRAVTHNMTYDKQLDAYKKAVLQKRLEEMSPEEIAQLQAELAAEAEADAKVDTQH